jgi:hypothetical protein
VTRLAAATAVVAGALLLVLPALTWFTADGPAGRVTATGLDASGGLWSVPVFGAVGVLAGVLVWRGPQRRGPMGLLAAAAGGAALAWTAWVSARVPVALVTTLDGGAREVGPEPARAWPAIVAPLAAAALLAAGAVLAGQEVRAVRTRPGGSR